MTLSDQNNGGLTAWRLSTGASIDAGIGGLGTAQMVTVDRQSVNSGGSISAVARLRQGGQAQRIASVTDVALVAGATTPVAFPDWVGDIATDGFEVTVPLGESGLITVGEVRGGQLFAADDDPVEAATMFTEQFLLDRSFAEVIGVAFDNGAGVRVQTDFVDSTSASHELVPEPLVDLAAVSAVREPRPAISWMLTGLRRRQRARPGSVV